MDQHLRKIQHGTVDRRRCPGDGSEHCGSIAQHHVEDDRPARVGSQGLLGIRKIR